ncbi:hypothetical protein ACFE04_031316 [Oxalis oulophora]
MEETKVKELGTSLLVPCVQELAKETLIAVPPRYLRENQVLSKATSTCEMVQNQIPVIDFQALFGDANIRDVELERLDRACKDLGFFQLINHGVNSSLVETLKLEILDFFNLTMEEKEKYWQKPGDMEGFGQAFVVSEEQKLDWSDMFYMITLPHDLRKPYLFPQLPLPFRGTLETYSAELKSLAMKILYLIQEAVGMERGEISELFEEGTQMMRMNYYPPCPQPERVIGLNSHTDGIGLTILLQINEVEGLQLKKDGIWIPVMPLPNAFIINIGDMLEIITNGIYQSREHRATVNSTETRLSIATFYSPNLEAEMGPAPSLITPESQALYKRILVADYFKGYFSRELNGKSYAHAMKIQKDTLEAYSAELKILAMKILYLIQEALGMECSEISELFEEGTQMMRSNYYPLRPRLELAISLTSHTDSIGLTILPQINEVECLRLKKAGIWVPVTPLSNAFIINILHIDDIILEQSREHRATVNSEEPRLSFTTFYSPNLESEMGNAPSLIAPKNPCCSHRLLQRIFLT